MLYRVKDVMTRTSFKFFENDDFHYCLNTFVESRLDGALVFNHLDELVGILTEKEVLKGVVINTKKVKEIMKPYELILNEDDLIKSAIHYLDSIYPVKNHKGELTGFITRSRILEKYGEQTQEELSHLDAIFNSAHNGILSIDDKGCITSINPAAVRMAGTTREKAIGKFLTDVVSPSGLLEVIRTGKPHSEKYQVGKRKYVTNRTPIFRNGHVVGAVGVFQDISEIEFISEELSSVKNILNELDIVLESSYDAILITDDKGKIIKANKAFKRILGLNEIPDNYEFLIGTYIESFLVSKVIEKKDTVTVMERNKVKNNLLMITGTPVLNTDSNIERVVINIRDITELDKLRRELDETKKYLSQLEDEKNLSKKFIAQSPSMKQVMVTVQQIAKVDSTVLILGESGVGKEEISKFIHQLSDRNEKPFIKVNCGAIPEHLLESELFGYEPGAFTGASKSGKMGLFEAAHKGTIFLDEIGELPLLLQVKLLRVLQEKEITRVGGVRPKKIDVRIIAATNQDLSGLVDKGEFRKDLYYRLNVVPIYVPPLRERVEDIPLLLALYQQRFAKQYKMEKKFTSEAINALMQYHWPGNVRELANVVERLFVTTPGPTIELKDIGIIFDSTMIESQESFVFVNGILPLKKAVDEVEKQLIKKALHIYKSTRRTAKVLQINQSTVVRKMQKFQEADWSGEEGGRS
ncbi:sigma 54-interacting transcriptional regulator [Microaerobacter geothermalis]|nr:sigma 54-interacting transcriptional regulator [Microaerobacter geothermalis]